MAWAVTWIPTNTYNH